MTNKINKSVYMISIDNVYYPCYHSKLYGKNSKPALVIKECLIKNEDDDAVFIEDEGWTSKKDFGYLNSDGNIILESFNPDNLSKIITAFEEHLIYLLDLVSNRTDWDIRPHFDKKVLTDFNLTRKDLIKIAYNLIKIEFINDLKKVSNGIWVKYLL